MTHLERLIGEANGAAEYGRAYAGYVSALLARLDFQAISRVADILCGARAEGRTVYLAGNGGSAAAAAHWATDLMHGTHAPGLPPLRAISLVDNVPLMTALSNDRGYEHVFVGQLERLLQPGDVLVVISASGNSPNVVGAVEYAKAHGAGTVGILGFDGGRLKPLCDVAVVVPTEPGEYGPVEDLHLVINHIVTTWLKTRLAARGR